MAAPQDSESSRLKPLQFGISHLLLLTVGVAVVCSLAATSGELFASVLLVSFLGYACMFLVLGTIECVGPVYRKLARRRQHDPKPFQFGIKHMLWLMIGTAAVCSVAATDVVLFASMLVFGSVGYPGMLLLSWMARRFVGG
jgi:hypothetical protein